MKKNLSFCGGPLFGRTCLNPPLPCATAEFLVRLLTAIPELAYTSTRTAAVVFVVVSRRMQLAVVIRCTVLLTTLASLVHASHHDNSPRQLPVLSTSTTDTIYRGVVLKKKWGRAVLTSGHTGHVPRAHGLFFFLRGPRLAVVK